MGITAKTNIHWVDRIKIEIRPLETSTKDKKSIQMVSIKFYPEDSVYEQLEVTGFTNHEFVEMKATVEKNLTTISIFKKEGKNGG